PGVDRPFPLVTRATVAALYEAVNELQSSVIPLLASPQGVAASSIRYCEATEAAAAGWFSFWFSIGKPPRPRDQRKLRDILLLARPPLLAVMQGGEYARFQFVHTFIDRRFYSSRRHRLIESQQCSVPGVER